MRALQGHLAELFGVFEVDVTGNDVFVTNVLVVLQDGKGSVDD